MQTRRLVSATDLQHAIVSPLFLTFLICVILEVNFLPLPTLSCQKYSQLKKKKKISVLICNPAN